jgi:hypothetical protein
MAVAKPHAFSRPLRCPHYQLTSTDRLPPEVLAVNNAVLGLSFAPPIEAGLAPFVQDRQ